MVRVSSDSILATHERNFSGQVMRSAELGIQPKKKRRRVIADEDDDVIEIE